MASATEQLNTRIDRDLKEEGDRTLSQHGISPSLAIRRFWSYLAAHRKLPDWLANDADASDSMTQSRHAAIVNGSGLATRLAGVDVTASAHPISYEQAIEAMYDDMAANPRGARV